MSKLIEEVESTQHEMELAPGYTMLYYKRADFLRLLEHTRKLEAMLKKHEWELSESGLDFCMECGGGRTMSGHSPDCELARLIE